MLQNSWKLFPQRELLTSAASAEPALTLGLNLALVTVCTLPAHRKPMRLSPLSRTIRFLPAPVAFAPLSLRRSHCVVTTSGFAKSHAESWSKECSRERANLESDFSFLASIHGWKCAQAIRLLQLRHDSQHSRSLELSKEEDSCSIMKLVEVEFHVLL